MLFETLKHSAIPGDAETLRTVVRRIAEEATANMSATQRARSWAGFDRDFSRKLGEAGLLGLTLPQEYGGGARDAFSRFVVVEELLALGAPVAAHWIGDRQSAPLILNFGTEEQQRAYLPGICSGELIFCIGMSEPGSGSDLASVRTRAEQNQGGWLINGQKIWTTQAMHADYMIALLRTSGGPDDRHRGLSQLIVDLKAPGVTIRPIKDVAGGEHFAEVFFDNVQMPQSALVGEEGQGWQQVTAELAFERSGPERIYSSVVLLEAWMGHLRDVGRVDPDTTAKLGGVIARMCALRAMSIACTARLAAGESPNVEASLVKDLGTQLEQDIPRIIGDDLAGHPQEPVDRDLHSALTFTSYVAPSFSLRGGTREVLRGIIARGLGLR